MLLTWHDVISRWRKVSRWTCHCSCVFKCSNLSVKCCLGLSKQCTSWARSSFCLVGSLIGSLNGHFIQLELVLNHLVSLTH